MQALNPLTMPLSGQSLIEASAGTGKTYTITGLYLRYLLGMQIPGELNTPLSTAGMLVDSCEQLATAPKSVQQAAKAGCLLLQNRYSDDDEGWLAKQMRLWQATAIYPPVLEQFDVRGLLPGYVPVRRRLAKLRQRLPWR